MQLITIISQSNTREVSNTISYEQAKEMQRISELRDKLNKMKETARYLYGKKRGAWGKMTMADEKRSNKIENLSLSLKYAVSQYETKYN